MVRQGGKRKSPKCPGATSMDLPLPSGGRFRSHVNSFGGPTVSIGLMALIIRKAQRNSFCESSIS
jgi:hypothetical protein